jgi:guanylate kinase
MTKCNEKLEGKKKSGLIFVITAPSGSGKTTLCQALVKNSPTIKYTISYTTRKLRKGEIQGRHYHFVSRDEFERMVKKDLFAEWAEVYGNLYGTLSEDIESLNRQGYDTLMDIDIQGAMQIKGKFKDAILIFICPPSLAVLEKRLLERGTDSHDVIKRRLEKVLNEMGYISKFDYMVINDVLITAINELQCIIVAEKLKTSHVNHLWIDNFA